VEYENDLKRDFPIPLIFTNKEKMIYENLFSSKDESNKNKNSRDYLQRIKEILDLPNDVEKDKSDLKSLLSINEEKLIIIL
jgi:cell shape-determining protein MreC